MTTTVSTKIATLFTLCSLFLIANEQCVAQARTPNAEARNLARRALALLDEGRAEAAIEQWDKVIAADSSYTPYQYEKCVALVMVKRFDEAIAILNKIYTDTLLLDRGYQLIGNCYDMKNDSTMSLKYYREGLKALPNSGRLHYEMGAAEIFDGRTANAMQWWLKGTHVEPLFATNYYWIAKIHASSPNKIWTCMFGEAFLNLETNTERTREMSKLLIGAWSMSLRLGDTTDPIQFASDELLETPHPKGAKVASFPLAFEIEAAQAGIPLTPKEGVLTALSIDQIVKIRTAMVKHWKSVGYDQLYDNAVMKWNVKLMEAGWLDEYLWYLYAWGNPKEMNTYYKRYGTKYDTFLAWFNNHQADFDIAGCIGIDCN